MNSVCAVRSLWVEIGQPVRFGSVVKATFYRKWCLRLSEFTRRFRQAVGFLYVGTLRKVNTQRGVKLQPPNLFVWHLQTHIQTLKTPRFVRCVKPHMRWVSYSYVCDKMLSAVHVNYSHEQRERILRTKVLYKYSIASSRDSCEVRLGLFTTFTLVTFISVSVPFHLVRDEAYTTTPSFSLKARRTFCPSVATTVPENR